MSAWTSSGSRRSEMVVKPETSAKSTLTCLRSPESAARSFRIRAARCAGVYARGDSNRGDATAGVAVDAADNVYVSTRGAPPVIVFDRDGNFLRSGGEGIFRRPHGITIGPNDTLWLTDDLHHTIRQFTAAGKLLLTIGDPDTPSTLQGGKPFNRPTHVALCPT